MFEKSKNLGQGAFGDVLKVKCLRSTCLSRDGTCRIVMTQQSVKRAKQERQKAEVAAGRNAAIANDYEKSMFQDDYYVAKTINVAHLNQKAQFEALNEIETAAHCKVVCCCGRHRPCQCVGAGAIRTLPHVSLVCVCAFVVPGPVELMCEYPLK